MVCPEEARWTASGRRPPPPPVSHPGPNSLVIRGATLLGQRDPVDVRLAGGLVSEVGRRLVARADDEVVAADGALLLPGLHDQHLHLLALAAAGRSVRAGPPEVADRRALGTALRSAPADRHGWVRAVGYHQSVAGLLDRWALDDLEPRRPVRLQHRSGALWMLNSAAVTAVGLDAAVVPGLERDGAGRPTGRLFRLDHWLRARLPPSGPPDLGAVGARLAAWGVTGITDATVTTGSAEVELLARSVGSGSLPQRVTVMGPLGLVAPPDSGLTLGPVKVVLADDDLPDPDGLAETVVAAHAEGRPVAVHCVTRAELVVAVAALQAGGAARGDRLEHGGVIPPTMFADLVALGVTVVTQPGFIAERGDAYLDEVDPADRGDLYRCASLLAAGVPVAAGSDAPFGPASPWRAVRSAVERTTPSGRPLGPDERLAPPRALGLFLGPPADPGGPARAVAPGAPADLCLLRGSLAEAVDDDDPVTLTVIGGRVVADHR